METHMKNHDDDEEDGSYICEMCAHQAMNQDQLLQHIERAHKHESYCTICETSFDSKNDLESHIF